MKSHTKLVLIALASVAAIGTLQLADAAVPDGLNYQAYLANTDGSAVDADVSITFAAYNVDVGGVPLWSQTQTVTVNQGLFTVTLGNPANPFPPGLEAVELIDRTGKLIEIDLNLSEVDGKSQLTLKFEGHSLVLETGSKNDLYQQMDRSPQMREQKQMRFAYQQDQIKKQRLAQQSASVEADSEIPRYTMPEKSDQRRTD